MPRAEYVSASVLGFMIIASAILPSIGYSNVLLSAVTSTVSASTTTLTSQIGLNQTQEPCTVMHPDPATLREWIRQYNSNPLAITDPRLSARASAILQFSLLSYLQYTPSERSQGNAGNCWVWAGTGVLEIALGVQGGPRDRLSIQYFDSNYNGGTTTIWGKWAGCGGSLTDFAAFYNTKKMAIPWSNTNAYYQDSLQSCESGKTSVSASSISTSPNYPITACAANTIRTQGVGQSTAIANIKNTLLQNKAVCFSFGLANSADWKNFNDFWKYQGERDRWSPDFSNGHTYNSNEGAWHSVLCVGWDDHDPNLSYWIMVNSWGTTSRRTFGIFLLDMNINYDCGYYFPSWPFFYYSLQWETLDVSFARHNVHLESREDNGASSNKGMISSKFEYFLPADIVKPSGSYSATYYPETGYSFVRWETSGSVSVSDAASQSTTVNVVGSGTLRAIYKRLQVMITISSNLPLGFSFARVDGAVITAPSAFTWTAGSTHTLEALSPVAGGSGVQYVWSSWSDGGNQIHTYTTPSSSQTVTANYKTQYYLTVTSAHDLPTPASAWFDAGTSITASVATPADQSGGTRYRCTGWMGTGSVPSSGSASSVTFTMGAPSSITWNWVAQYYLTINTNPAEVSSLNPSAVSGQAWYDSGTTAPVNALQNVDKVLGSSRYDFRSWIGANPIGSGNQASVLMDGPKTATANYQLQYKITFAQSGVGNDFTGTVVTIDGANYAVSGLPASLWWDDKSTHSFAFSSPLVVTANVKQYVWTSTTGLSTVQSGSVTISSSGSVIGNYKTQYQVTLTSSGIGTDTGTTIITTVNGVGYRQSQLPYSAWYDSGTPITYAFASTVSAGLDKQYIWMSTSGLSQTDRTGSFTVSAAGTVTANYKTQYQVTFGHTGLDNTAVGAVVTVDGSAKIYSDLPFSRWVDSSTSVSYSYTTIVSSGATGKQFRLDSVAGPSSPIAVTGPTIVTGNYKIQWKIFFDASANVKSDTSPATIVKIDGINKTAGDLPLNKWVDDGSSVSYSYYSPVSSSVTGKRYRWDSTSGLGQTLQSNTFTVTGTGTVTASYKTQHQLTMQATPSDSGSTSPTVGTYWYDAGTSVTISATPAVGRVFWSWTGVGVGNYTGSSNPASIAMNGPISEKATFATLTTIMISTTTSVTSTTNSSVTTSTTQRSTTNTTAATFPYTSHRTTTSTLYSGSTSTTYTVTTTLFSTSTSVRTNLLASSTDSLRAVTRTSKTGTATVTQTYSTNVRSVDTIYVRITVYTTFIERFLETVISTLTRLVNELTQLIHDILVMEIIQNTTVLVEPERGTCRIMLDASPKPGYVGKPVNISGVMYGSWRCIRDGMVVGKNVTITVGWGFSTNATTDYYGRFSVTTNCPPTAGTYPITATFYEDQDLRGNSTSIMYVVTAKIPTSITISYVANRQFEGYLRRQDTGAYLAYKPVRLTVTYLSGTTWQTSTYDLQTRQDGYYSLEFLLYWNKATIMFEGDETYTSCSATLSRGAGSSSGMSSLLNMAANGAVRTEIKASAIHSEATSRIVLDASPEPGYINKPVNISGVMYGSWRCIRDGMVVGKPVEVVTGWGFSRVLTTDYHGRFYVITNCPSQGGTYPITTTFYEDQDLAASSTTISYEVIAKIPTTLTISYVSNREFGGYLRRADTGAYLANKPVRLTVTYLSGTTWRTDSFDLQTRQDGYWSLEFLFYWNSATVVFEGDETYASSSAAITR